MLIALTTLLATLASIFRSRAALQLENLALRHQIGILQRSARKRPKLTPADRLLWVALSRIWRDWRSALAIVKPETVVAWHRAGSRKLQRAVGSTFCGAQSSARCRNPAARYSAK
jgi:putative transposase